MTPGPGVVAGAGSVPLPGPTVALPGPAVAGPGSGTEAFCVDTFPGVPSSGAAVTLTGDPTPSVCEAFSELVSVVRLPLPAPGSVVVTEPFPGLTAVLLANDAFETAVAPVTFELRLWLPLTIVPLSAKDADRFTEPAAVKLASDALDTVAPPMTFGFRVKFPTSAVV